MQLYPTTQATTAIIILSCIFRTSKASFQSRSIGLHNCCTLPRVWNQVGPEFLGQTKSKTRLLSLQRAIMEQKNLEQNDTGCPIHTHYIFLIHGWLGNSKEMGFLESSINTEVASIAKASSTIPSGTEATATRIVTHSAKCNDEKTTDGIAIGGSRLAQEIQQFIIEDMQSNTGRDALCELPPPEHNCSISFVGNSLGGLYARFALSLIPDKLQLQSDDSVEESSMPSVNLHRQIFATTATPHLGVASHTFLPIPRTLEHFISRTLKSTGRDLFRTDDIDLIYEMSTDYETFLRPLSLFRKRIAYVNAFRTDFQVPTSTAAFLSKNSAYPHFIDEAIDVPFLVAIARTDEKHDILIQKIYKEQMSRKQTQVMMSTKLDALGWQKVFIDVRGYIPIPGIALPSFLKRSSRQKWDDFIKSQQVSGGDENKKQVESRDLERMMSGSDRLDIPVGHQVMVANSKSKSYSKFTEKGRPVMNYLAGWMVKELKEAIPVMTD